MVTVRAWASMLFSTSSAIALSGLFWESAMMVMAFQLSPIRRRPLGFDGFFFPRTAGKYRPGPPRCASLDNAPALA